MALSSLFYAFIDLVQFDQNLNTLHKEIVLIRTEIDVLKKEQAEFDVLVAQAKDMFHQAKKEVDEKELEMKELDESEKTKKNMLDQTSDHKVYQLLKNEIATIKRKQHGLEDQLVKAWNKLENAKKHLDEQKNIQERKNSEINEKMAVLENKIAHINAQIDAENIRRKPLEAAVPQEWIEKYTVMKARVTNPVVPSTQGSCSVCFYKIPDQDMIRMKDQELVQCKDCFRLLYLPEIMEKEAKQDQVQS